MGVTIHFEGRLRDDAAHDAVISMARDFAAQHGWDVTPIEMRTVALQRVKDDEDRDYEGPVKGLEIWPHENCEPLRLEFDKDLYVQEYTKTQFAPIGIHVAVIEFLKSMEPHFRNLIVYDEAEYFETEDLEKLKYNFERFFEVFHEELAKSDEYRGPFRLPSGRMVDLVTKRGLPD